MIAGRAAHVYALQRGCYGSRRSVAVNVLHVVLRGNFAVRVSGKVFRLRRIELEAEPARDFRRRF